MISYGCAFIFKKIKRNMTELDFVLLKGTVQYLYLETYAFISTH